MNNFLYHINQTGLNISCEEQKITINKYENKMSKLLFSFDDRISDGSKYFALLNPETLKYKYYPVQEEDDSVIIGTYVSGTAGKWQCLLLAVDEDYTIEDDDLDTSKVTYVSNVGKFIVVKDNFLDKTQDETIQEEESVVNQILSRMIQLKSSVLSLFNQTKTLRDQAQSYSNSSSGYATTSKTYSDSSYASATNAALNATKSETARDNARNYAKESKAWSTGDPAYSDTVNNNSKYYAEKAYSSYSSVDAKVSSAKTEINNYVTQAKESMEAVYATNADVDSMF